MSDPIKYFTKFADYITDVQSDIENDEGFSPTIYKDSRGFETIGHGLKVNSRRKQLGNLVNGITKQQSSEIVSHIIRNEIIPGLQSRFKNYDKWPDGVKRGVINMYYNFHIKSHKAAS